MRALQTQTFVVLIEVSLNINYFICIKLVRFYFCVTFLFLCYKRKVYAPDFFSNWFSTPARTSSSFDQTGDTSGEGDLFLRVKANYKLSWYQANQK